MNNSITKKFLSKIHKKSKPLQNINKLNIDYGKCKFDEKLIANIFSFEFSKTYSTIIVDIKGHSLNKWTDS